MGDTFRTILVAIAVKGSDERDRQTRIVSALNGIEDRVPGIDSWWIADDLRYHMQDGAYDSAIFVPYGSQMIARKLISQTREEAHGQEGQTSD